MDLWMNGKKIDCEVLLAYPVLSQMLVTSFYYFFHISLTTGSVH